MVVRLVLLVWAGDAPETPLTGGGDTFAYQTLADSIVHLRGMTYAGIPTALRAPLYPFFLAFLQLVFDSHYRVVARLIRFFVGIATAVICARTSEKLGEAGTIALAAALAMPTLIFFSPELLTETFATMFVAAFFWVVLENKSPIAIGAVIGLAMLTRFNLTALAIVYVVYQLVIKKIGVAVREVSVAGLIAVVIVSPWFVRNLIVFDGGPSTQPTRA